MPYLVGSSIAERLLHKLVRENVASDPFVNSGSLHEPPIVQKAYDVMIPNDIGRKNFARTWVNIRWSHGVGGFCGYISETGISHVVGFEPRAVGRIVNSLYRISETGFFKCNVPYLNSLFNGIAPLFRKRTVNIEYYWLLRLNQFAFEISFAVFLSGLYSPAFNILLFSDAVCVCAVNVFV